LQISLTIATVQLCKLVATLLPNTHAVAEFVIFRSSAFARVLASVLRKDCKRKKK